MIETASTVKESARGRSMTALELAMIATGRINAMNEKASMQTARDAIRTIASLFEIDAEYLWKEAFYEWYRIGREAHEASLLEEEPK